MSRSFHAAVSTAGWITLVFLLTGPAWAQRGVGQSEGVARQRADVKFAEFRGEVAKVLIGPCEKTTGRSPQGAHILVKAVVGGELKEVNIHLGPAAVLEKLTSRLAVGQEVVVRGFRTEAMAADHYNAQRIRFAGREVVLRDADTLRPFWAGGGRAVAPFAIQGSEETR